MHQVLTKLKATMFVIVSLTSSKLRVWYLYSPFICSGVPDTPGSPEASNITETSATLNWKAPTSDGGSPITNYDIEKREGASGRWTTCNKFDVSETSFTVRDLRAGHEYSFRVTAVNKAGSSKPSVPSETFKAQPPYGKNTNSIQLFRSKIIIFLYGFIYFGMLYDYNYYTISWMTWLQ